MSLGGETTQLIFTLLHALTQNIKYISKNRFALSVSRGLRSVPELTVIVRVLQNAPGAPEGSRSISTFADVHICDIAACADERNCIGGVSIA